MVRPIRELVLVLFILGVAALPAGAEVQSLEQPDALIGGGEQIDDHEAGYEDIHDHEGKTEDIHDHEGKTEDIHNHEGKTEDIHDHHAESESLDGRSVESERLFGMENDPDLALSAARQKLLDARQRHARVVRQAEKAVVLPTAEDLTDHGTWPHRLEVAQHRILVAEANLQIYDRAYADMIRNDYPRGDARQDLIDSRDRAKGRFESERALLPRLVQHAREAGVPQSVLYDYETDH
jgi:hypothetical protein